MCKLQMSQGFFHCTVGGKPASGIPTISGKDSANFPNLSNYLDLDIYTSLVSGG